MQRSISINNLTKILVENIKKSIAISSVDQNFKLVPLAIAMHHIL